MNDIDSLVLCYETRMQKLQAEEKPGQIRAKKANLVTTLAQRIVRLAWRELDYPEEDLNFKTKYKVELCIEEEYIKTLAKEIQLDIKENLKKYKYKLKIDVPVFCKGSLVVAVECKAYAENAMLKRVLFDAEIVRRSYPNIKNVLFQLESQMRGDYSDITKPLHFGSGPSQALMSFFPNVRLHIITLLEGERNIIEPIHEKKYHKPLTKESVERAVATIKSLIKASLD